MVHIPSRRLPMGIESVRSSELGFPKFILVFQKHCLNNTENTRSKFQSLNFETCLSRKKAGVEAGAGKDLGNTGVGKFILVVGLLLEVSTIKYSVNRSSLIKCCFF